MQWFLFLCLLLGVTLGVKEDDGLSVSPKRELCDREYDELLMLDEKEFKTPDGFYQPIFKKYNGEECRFSDFTKVKVLGEGAAAMAILMKHNKSDAQVVFKRHDSASTNLFNIAIEEIILHKLDNMYLPKGFCSFFHKDTVYVGMHYESEVTFASLLGKNNDIEYKDLQIYARQFVDVLEYLHDRDIIYNDIKPDNVLLIKDGDAPPRIQVIDFNLANYVPRGIAKGRGTPLYMSPEKLDDKEYTNAADWYAFGIMLAELADNMHPFEDAEDIEDLREIVGKTEQIRVSKSKTIETFVQNLCEKDKDKRWSQANNKMDDIRGHEFIKSNSSCGSIATRPPTILSFDDVATEIKV